MHGIAGATHYRIMAEFASGDGLTGVGAFGSTKPMTEQWHIFQFGPFVDDIQQPVDADGWYPVLDVSWNPIHLLMNWNTNAMGTYRLTLELGQLVGPNIVPVGPAATAVTFAVDNNVPTVDINIVRWRESPGGPWQALPAICPVIERTPGLPIEVQVVVSVTAPHLRAVDVSAGGCGAANPIPTSVTHWHTD